MPITIKGLPYNDPSTDALVVSGEVTWDLEEITSRDGQSRLWVARSSTGQRVDLTRLLKTATYGRALSPILDGGKVGFLSTKFTSGTTLVIHNATSGSNPFAAGDLVAIVKDYNEYTGAASAVVYRKVSSVTTTIPTANVVVDSDPGQTFLKGSMILRVSTLEDIYWKTLAWLESVGLKGEKERPPTPTYSTNVNGYQVTVAAGPTLTFRIYNPQKSSGSTQQYKQRWYDIYVRPYSFSSIHLGWLPDASDVTFTGTDVDATYVDKNVTTHSGGADAIEDQVGDAVIPTSGTFVDGDVNTGTDTITDTAHGLSDGTRVKFSNSGGALPGGITAGTIYYIISATDNTFKISTTFGGSAVDITSAAGGGTHTWTNVDTPGNLSINTRYYVAVVAKDKAGARHLSLPNESAIAVTAHFTGTS